MPILLFPKQTVINNQKLTIFLHDIESLFDGGNEIDSVIVNLKNLIAKFESEFGNGNEIKTSNDFFSAKYLGDPDNNFHGKILEIKNKIDEFLLNFIGLAKTVILKIDNVKSKSLSDTQIEIQKLARLRILIEKSFDITSKKYIKAKIKELLEVIRATYKRSSMVELLHVKNGYRNDLTLKEANLEDEMSRILQEYDVKKSSDLKRLKRILINLIDVYLEEIRKDAYLECKLENDEIILLVKARRYFIFFSSIPKMFQDILDIHKYLFELKDIRVHFEMYSKKIKLQEIANVQELFQVYDNFRRYDYLPSDQGSLDRAVASSKLKDGALDREKLMYIVPRELVIDGINKNKIYGDLYLKDPSYKPKIGIIALHGVYDSRKVYYSLGVRAAMMGFFVFCPDMPGHGYTYSGDQKFGAASENILYLIRHLKSKYGLEKIAVIGWSLGSIITLFASMHYTKRLQDFMEERAISLDINPVNPYKDELKEVMYSEFHKYEDCKIDSILLLAPVDYPQIAFYLRKPQKALGRLYEPFVNTLLWLTDLEAFRILYQRIPDRTNPKGSRFYFDKNRNIKSVKIIDGQTKSDQISLFEKIRRKLKLYRIDDPIQMRALKFWNRQQVKDALLAPSAVDYFKILLEISPDLANETRKIPKTIIHAAEDKLVGFRKRGVDLVKAFESFGNVNTTVLSYIGHDLDYNGTGHDLYIDPVLIKHFNNFLLSLAKD